ncbi:calcium ATPase [Pelomyxa schiedti]|nr:calcium ATPase [Pelomyxa schiedti]
MTEPTTSAGVGILGSRSTYKSRDNRALIEELERALDERERDIRNRHCLTATVLHILRNLRFEAILVAVVLLALAFISSMLPEQDLGPPEQSETNTKYWWYCSEYAMETTIAGAFLALDILVAYKDRILRHMVVVRRARAHLRSPDCERINLLEVGHEVLTRRDGVWRFVPQNLLVTGDAILVPQGAPLPAKATPVAERQNTEPHSPLTEQEWLTEYIVDESPARKQLELALQAPSIRPRSRLGKHRAFTLIFVAMVMWIALPISIAINVVRYSLQEGHVLSEIVLARPAHIMLALLPIALPHVLWTFIESYGNARILALVDVQQNSVGLVKKESMSNLAGATKPAESGAASAPAAPDFGISMHDYEKGVGKRARAVVPWRKVVYFFWALLFDTNPVLQRTSPLAQSLGAVTALVCMDKDGTLVEPMSRPEQVYLFNNGGMSLSLQSSDSTAKGKLEFTDPNWQVYLRWLKALGLNLLLNKRNCRHRKKHPVTGVGNMNRWKRVLVSLLANFSRPYTPCMCRLHEAIGFKDEVLDNFGLEHFKPVKDIHAYAPMQNGGVPYYMFSQVYAVAGDSGQDSFQVFTKGNVPFILQHCTQYWNEQNKICRLTAANKSAILAEFERLHETFYCVGFAYKLIKKKERWMLGHLTTLPEVNSGPDCLNEHSRDYQLVKGLILKGVPPSGEDDSLTINLESGQLSLNSSFPLLPKQSPSSIEFYCGSHKSNEIPSEGTEPKSYDKRSGFQNDPSHQVDEKNGDHEKKKRDHEKKKAHSKKNTDGESITPNDKKPARMKKAIKDSPSSSSENSNKQAHETTQTDKDKLLTQGQIFLAMVSLRAEPKSGTPQFVQGLQKAGVRFRYFSDENQIRSTLFAQQMGLDTTWNYIISLRDPGPNDSIFMEGASKLPRGIGAIRHHIENIDNVPLLVPIFAECTPESKREMIKILQENGEVVLCVGSALNMNSTPSYVQADVAAAIQPLPSQWVPSDEPDDGHYSSSPPTASTMPKLSQSGAASTPFPRLTSERFTQFRTTGSLSADITCLPCSFVMHCDTPLDVLLTLIKEGRHILRNTTQTMHAMFVLCLICLSVDLLAVMLLVPEPLTGYQILWLELLLWPMLAFSLMAIHIPQKTMSQMSPKNYINPQVVLRNIRHAVIVGVPVIFCAVALFLITLEPLWGMGWKPLFGFGFPEVSASTSSSSSETIWYDTFEFKCSRLYAQNMVMLLLVWCAVALTASYSHPSLAVWHMAKRRSRCRSWVIASICACIAQIAFSVVSVAVQDNLAKVTQIPWYSWVLLTLSAPATIVIDGILVKWPQRKWHKHYQLLMKLYFDTKLGLYSPRETPLQRRDSFAGRAEDEAVVDVQPDPPITTTTTTTTTPSTIPVSSVMNEQQLTPPAPSTPLVPSSSNTPQF